jgi:hypothetical protein
MSNGNSDRKQPPSHRLYVYHDDDHYTEVGAVWPHRNGEGFNITIKEGLAIAPGAKLVAYKNEPREQRDEREQRDDRNERNRGRR